MANYGFLGAMQGGAKSVSDQMLMKMEESKAARLVELRGGISRETNTLNNDQRNEHAVSQQTQRNSDALALQEQGNENSLAKMKLEDEYKTNQKPTFEMLRENPDDPESQITGQVSNTGEWKRAGQTSGTRGNQTPSNILTMELLQSEFGMSQEEAASMAFPKTGVSKDEYRRSLISKFADDYRLQSRRPKIDKTIETLMEKAYPEAPKGQHSFQELFDELKSRNGDKYSDEDIQKYIMQTHGVSPE